MKWDYLNTAQSSLLKSSIWYKHWKSIITRNDTQNADRSDTKENSKDIILWNL